MDSRHARSVIVAAVFLFGIGCGGGGGGGSGNDGGSLATIQGRVTEVVTEGTGVGLTGVASGVVGGIRVEARELGQTLAVDTTDAAGNFTLEFVGGGDIELVFLSEDFTLSLRLVALPGSVVTLVVELRPLRDEVVVVDDDGASGPLRCQTGTLVIADDDLELVIDGRGEDCVRAEGNCDVEIVARSVTFIDCEACVRTAGNSRATILAEFGSVVCEAREEGIRASGTSRVEVDAFDDVVIDASEHGIRAEGNAEVFLGALGTCIVDSFEPLRVEGNAVVDTAACRDLELFGD